MVTADRPTFLSKILTQYRLANCLTQDEVAAKIGLTRSAYSYYELGKSEPSNDNLMLLAKLYGAQLEDFFPVDKAGYFLSDSKFPNSPEPRPTNMGGLSDEERRLIALYRISANKDKEKIIDELTKSAQKNINSDK